MRVARAPGFRDLDLGGYELLLELAAGGMATVYVARKRGAAGFEKLVVVKRVHPAFAQNREFADMFRDEARICSTIRHPNVVSTLDVVEADGELFLVIEYVESMSLSALLAAARAAGAMLPAPVVVRIMADGLAGLHAAHETKDLRGNRLDVIHRDVSPQNIIVGADGSSRLIDFGVAKAASRISVTQSGALKGKLGYMSPEQVRRRPLDRRADVFAAGAVLFEALTQRKLFTGEDEGDIVLGILVAEIPPPSSLVPGIPVAVDEVVARALAREPDERYATAAEFADDLERALTPANPRDVSRVLDTYGAVLAEQRRKLVAVMSEERPEPTVTDASSQARPSLARLVSRIVLGVGLVLAVAIAAVVVDRRRSHDVPAPTARSIERSSEAPVITPPPPSVAVSVPSAPAPAPTSPSTRGTPRPTPGRDLHRRNPYGPP